MDKVSQDGLELLARIIPSSNSKSVPKFIQKEDHPMMTDKVETLIKTKMRSKVKIIHLKEQSGESVVFLSYSIDDQNNMTIWHTEVPPALQHMGLGAKLVEDAFQLAKIPHRSVLCARLRRDIWSVIRNLANATPFDCNDRGIMNGKAKSNDQESHRNL